MRTTVTGGARASANPFAHLMGGFRPGAGRPKGEKDDEGKDDEEARKARRAEEDQQRQDEDARRAEEDQRRKDEDARRAEEDDKEPGADDSDDDDESEDEAKGRKAERSRWTSVMGHKNAGGRVATACNLLATTDMSADAIVRTLATIPAEQTQAAAPNLRERMSTVDTPNVGADTARGSTASPAKTKANAFLAAAAKADPKRVVAPGK